MFTKNYLEILKSREIKEVLNSDLVDINKIKIDIGKPIYERINAFLNEIKNPYLFKVGTTTVKISFTEKSNSIQNCLKNFISSNY